MVEGLELRVYGLGSRFLGFRVHGSYLGFMGVGFRVLGFRV